MIIMMMASNKGGILKAPRKASVYSTLSTTLDTNTAIVVTISCTAKSLFPFCVIYLLRNVSYTKKDKQKHDFFFIVVGQNVIEITTNINEVDMTHGKYL